MVNGRERRVREEARQRDHRQPHDLLAGFLADFEEGRRSGRSMVFEPLALFSPKLANHVGRPQQCFLSVIPRYVRIRRTLKLSRHREVSTK